MKPLALIIGVVCATQIVLADTLQYNNTGKNHCYKVREIMYPLEETFDALKQTLMLSNLNIVTVTKTDGVLTAKGNQYNEDEDTILGLTLTVDFKERDRSETTVRVIASYETIQKKSDTGQIGGGGITLPIPVPFTGKYTLVGQGNIDDSAWYRGFFNSLDRILFENHMKYRLVKKPDTTQNTVNNLSVTQEKIEESIITAQNIKTEENLATKIEDVKPEQKEPESKTSESTALATDTTTPSVQLPQN